MTELYGSKRTAERATLTPIRRRRRTPDRPEDDHGGAWHKWSYFAALSPSAAEFRKIADRLPNATDSDRVHLRRLGELVAGSHDVPRVALAVDSARHFTEVPTRLLETIGNALAAVRSEVREEALAAQKELLTLHTTQSSTPAPGEAATGDEAAVPAGYEPDPTFVDPALPGYRMYRLKESRPTVERLPETAERASAGRPDPLRASEVLRTPARRGATLRGTTASTGFFLAPPPVQAIRSTPAAAGPATLNDLVEAGTRAGASSSLVERAIASITLLRPADGAMTMMDYEMKSGMDVNSVKDFNLYYSMQQQNEPIGMLHLERLNFIPAGIERGELMSSVPLSPAEEVNISHKEWSNTSEEFHRIVTDYLEQYSEEGVVEKSELSQSTSSQHQHSSGFNMSVTASGGFGPVSVTTSMGYNVADSASASEATARQQSSEVTRKAASRTRKEHKVSFKVASAAGTEDQAVRKIKNPFDDKATRIDFYQLVRKWQVDLYRYGIRLTYDLTIPEPGSDVLSKIVEINDLRADLEEPFGPNGTTTWSNFVLKPSEVTRTNYAQKAAQYGVAIEPPPVFSIKIPKSYSRNWGDIGETENGLYIGVDVEVPDGYEVYSATAGDSYVGNPDTIVLPHTNVATMWPKAFGRLTRTVLVKEVVAYETEIIVWVTLKTQVYQAWQMRAWAALRDAARSRYEAQRAMIKERLAKLQEEIGGQDPLSLRKMEREEVMKGVLRWLFGPSFVFVPPSVSSDLYDFDEVVKSNSTWGHVLAHGEIIKFLHHAIEWENMTYFLYPYFWSHTSRWELKKYLDHPDFQHRAFLKAGAARVVLTVRPGFEKDFVSFVETGGFGPLGGNHPYLTIAQEIEAFAKTNYPGIRAANPEDAARPLLTPLQRKAWKAMESIVALLEKFKVAKGRYPDTAEGLDALLTYGTIESTDPWGNDFGYDSPGKVSDFELWTLGADGLEGGSGEDADITSWAEASLVARWFDYTPTSALDISFNDTLPTA